MRRHVLLSFGFLFAVLLGCKDLSGPRADSYPAETSAAFFFGGGASISLEKSTNGQDADASPGPSITPGDPVVWEYRVINTGAEALSGVYVMDDREGLICEIGSLAVGAGFVCREEKVAQAGSYTNVGTVYGYALLSTVEASDRSHYEGEESGSRTPSVQVVGIQIKPGGKAPCINASSKGRTPVAILASSGFDPLVVDPHTILAGDLVPPVRWGRGEDVNEDGLLDLVVHFKTQELNAAGLLQDGADLLITGETFEGGSFTGTDLVRLAGGLFCR
jgi:hypothetical protein